jgi:agmatinase
LLVTVKMMLSLKLALAIAAAVAAHGDHDDQTPIEGPHKQLWYNTLPGDGGMESQISCSKNSY